MSAPDILLAEDDRHLREGLAQLLAMEGFACRAFDSALALEAELARSRPRLVVLDVMLPGRSGLEACAAIRRRDPDLPILILSARDTEIDRVLGLEQGADDYLTKPFGPRELVARIRALLRRAGRAPAAAAACFPFGDLMVDEASLRARREGEVIELSNREVRLLRVFFERRGQALTRDALFDLVWGRDYMPSSRALDQFVSALRRKIERDAARPVLIRTVHGHGYRHDG